MFEVDPNSLPEPFRVPTITPQQVYESLGGPIYGVSLSDRLKFDGAGFSGKDSVQVSYRLQGSSGHYADLEVVTEFAEDFGPDERGVPSYIDGRLDSFISNHTQNAVPDTSPTTVEPDSQVSVDGQPHAAVHVAQGEFWALGVPLQDRYIIATGHESLPAKDFVTIYPQVP